MDWTGISYNGKQYPGWAEFLGWMLCISAVLCVPGYAFYRWWILPEGTAYEVKMMFPLNFPLPLPIKNINKSVRTQGSFLVIVVVTTEQMLFLFTCLLTVLFFFFRCLCCQFFLCQDSLNTDFEFIGFCRFSKMIKGC